MCVVCGCGTRQHSDRKNESGQPGIAYRQVRAAGFGLVHLRDPGQDDVHRDAHAYQHAHGLAHSHARVDAHVAIDTATGDLHYGAGPASVSVPGMSQARAIRLEQDVLSANDRHAADNRAHFARHGILALNLVSSPGSGKTTLLCATIAALKQRSGNLSVAVIEGDQQTSHDADRIRAAGAPAIQINTGKGCHLDAQMVSDGFARLPPQWQGEGTMDAGTIDVGITDRHDHDSGDGILFIENVGNLVCPAMWDLGESAKVVILSVTEGEDKPLKYPDMFAAARLMVLNKTDLLPYVQFDVAACIAYARRVNPQIEVLQLSATGGQGMAAWLDWIAARHRSLVQ